MVAKIKSVSSEHLDPNNLTASHYVNNPNISDQGSLEAQIHPDHPEMPSPPSLLSTVAQDMGVPLGRQTTEATMKEVEEDTMPKKDVAPKPKRTIEFDSSTPEFRHEICVGRKVTAVLAQGVIVGEVVARDNALVSIKPKNGNAVTVGVTDIYKIQR